MAEINFDLRSFREDVLKMTQEQFAQLIGKQQHDISRYEKNPKDISIDVLVTIASRTGSTLDELIKYEKSKVEPLYVEDTWSSVNQYKGKVLDYVNDQIIRNDSLWKEGFEAFELEDGIPKILSQLKKQISFMVRKPKVALVGYSDAGKSTLINSLLGSEKLPVSWTPATSIAVYIKHIDDKPKYIEEDVWIFKKDHNNSSGLWEDSRINDESYCKRLLLSKGNYDLLKSYGTRQGEHFDANEAVAAVAFVDSQMLKNCDIIDLPGYGTGDRAEDDDSKVMAKNQADILIYLSVANTFLHGEEMVYIRECLESRSSLEDIFIVASQAHTVSRGNQQQLEYILDTKAKDMYEKVLTDGLLSKINCTDIHKLRKRFFTYSTDIQLTRERFEETLIQRLEFLPTQIEDTARQYIIKMQQEANEELKKSMEPLRGLMVLEATSPLVLTGKENKATENDITGSINTLKKEAIEEFISRYRSSINVDNIVSIIKNKGYKKKKDEIQLLVTYITGLINDQYSEVMQKKNKQFVILVDKYLKDFEDKYNFDADMSRFIDGFNFKRAFLSGLAGLSALGGLAIWASTLGNLGAYILIAKGVSLLSALGISVGGTASAITFVSSIGGPITIGIGIAILAGLAIFALVSGGWQKQVAKKIVKTFEEEGVLGTYIKEIEKYWDETNIAFHKCADKMEEETSKHIELAIELARKENQIKKGFRLKAYEKMFELFKSIPI